MAEDQCIHGRGSQEAEGKVGDAGCYIVARQQHKGPSGHDMGLADLSFTLAKNVFWILSMDAKRKCR